MIPLAIIEPLAERLKAIADTRPPDLVIGDPANPYLLRWWVIPRVEKEERIYLHKMLRSDDDRALHDHPADNVSLILEGGYDEVVPVCTDRPNGPQMVLPRRAGDVIVRRAADAHRLVMRESATWSLFTMGPTIREWGFHCPKGWRSWGEFCTTDGEGKNTGQLGRGCD